MASYPELLSALDVANPYLRQERSAYLVAEELGRLGTVGAGLAGEVMMDYATKSDPPEARIALRHATDHFRAVHDSYGALPPHQQHQYASQRVMAGFRLAEMPCSRVIYGNCVFPDFQTVNAMYGKLIEHTADATRAARRFVGDKSAPATAFRGMLGVASVSLLATRSAAIHGAAAEDGYPIMLRSVLGESTGGDCVKKATVFTWQLNGFTRVDGDGPGLTKRLRVRSHRYAEQSAPGPTVYVTDLAIVADERGIEFQIVKDCVLERRAGNNDVGRGASERLNRRADKLVEIIYSE